MTLLQYAKEEVIRAGLFDKDSDYGGEIGKAVLQLVKTFSRQEHSGGSAQLTLDIFNRVAKFQPLTPLTFKEDEWFKIEHGNFQNKRDPNVFKNENGKITKLSGNGKLEWNAKYKTWVKPGFLNRWKFRLKHLF